jgi:hypothetical protein
MHVRAASTGLICSPLPCEAEQLPLAHTQVVAALRHLGLQATCSPHRALELHRAQHLPQPRVSVLRPRVQVGPARSEVQCMSSATAGLHVRVHTGISRLVLLEVDTAAAHVHTAIEAEASRDSAASKQQAFFTCVKKLHLAC